MPRILTQSDVADFRERLCDAATRMFDARGPEGFTMRELAAELGVSAMTPYRYFKDKEDILAAVRARAFNRFADGARSRTLAMAKRAQDAAAVYRAYVAFAFGEPAAYKLMFDLTQPDESLYPDLVKANARARATMTDYVQLMVDKGELRRRSGPDRSRVLGSRCTARSCSSSPASSAPNYDFDRISDEASRVLFDAYRPKRA